MPVTPYIPATAAVVDDGSVSNVQNLTDNFSGVSTIINTANITLTFGDISSFLPSNAVITGIGFKYSGIPNNITFLSGLTSTIELENPNFLNINDAPASNVTKTIASQNFSPSSNGVPFSFETSNPTFEVVQLLQIEEAVHSGNSNANNVDIVIPGIVTGNTVVKLKFFHNSFTNINSSFTADMELDGTINDGDEVPGIQITYETPGNKTIINNNTKVKIQQQPLSHTKIKLI
tara:strand:- start:307 stop:1005 length:699 start_codon:yes stop_codon:yes gene_type:complete